ncbi:MAG: hypothetical protein ACTSPM_11880 [Candidatus Heimdallarchaeota archaeon]
MSSKDYDDDEYYTEIEEEEEEEEWEYSEDEEKEKLRDRVSIWDIVKLIGLFAAFALFFLYFRYWDFLVNLLSFGNEDYGLYRLIFITILLFPVAAAFFLTGLVKVSKTLFIPAKETSAED